MLENIKAVLFDMDGTLVDSIWIWGEIDIEYLGKHGYQVPAGLQQEIEGMSFSECAAYFKERFQISDSIESIKAEWVESAKEKYAHEVPLKPGAIRFLKHLKEKGIPMGIATSSSRELLDTVMESLNLSKYMDYCMTSCEAGTGKPAPDIYLKVAEHLGVSPKECLIFEDTPTGMQAGINAGSKVCAVADTFSESRKDLIFQLADYYIESYDEILDGTYKSLKAATA